MSKAIELRGSDVAMIPLPSANTIIFAQRVDYIPILKANFEKDRARIIDALTKRQSQASIMKWLQKDDIDVRTGWKRAE